MIQLGEVADFEMGQAPPGTECNVDGVGTVFVKAGEFSTPYPLEREWTTKPLKFGKQGDVFICVVGATAGKLNLGIDCAIGRSVAAIRPKPPLDTKFLYYQLLPSVLKLRAASAGSAQGVISKKQLSEIQISLPPISEQAQIVAVIEKQFSRLDEAVANLKRVKANLKRYEKSAIESLTNPETFDECVNGSIADIATSLDNMRKPVNKAERATRQGNVPYLGANGQTGWIDDHLFDEEIVLVVEDETFVGRTAPFCYYFAGKCWVNNHTHVLRAKPGVVSPKYLNLALSYYPFIPLTTGSTGRRKLTKGALMVAPIVAPSLAQQNQIVLEVERRLSLTSGVLAEVEKNLQRSEKLRQAVLATAFGIKSAQPEH